MISRFLLFVPLYFRLNFCLIEEIYPLKQCFQTVFHLTELSVTRLTGIDFVIANDILMQREYFLLFVGPFKRGCWMASCPQATEFDKIVPNLVLASKCTGLQTNQLQRYINHFNSEPMLSAKNAKCTVFISRYL